MSRFDNMQADALDGRPPAGEGARVMTRTPLIITLAAAAALAGCNSSDHNIVEGGPEPGDNVATNGPVALPPSIAATKPYRCADNSLIYVDWLSDGSAHVKNKSDEVGTPVPAGSPDLKGDAKSASITYKGKSCKA
jgi:hypothetical protein